MWFDEEEVDSLIGLLKDAKAKAWPKPPTPLCSQARSLLSYLQRHEGITPLKAAEELDIAHLPRRVKDLRENGHEIVRTLKRSDRGKRYAHYALKRTSRAFDVVPG